MLRLPVLLPFVLFAGACSTPEPFELTFASDRHESLDLMGMAPDSSSFIRYTAYEGTEYNPDWSPDGAVLAYTRWSGSDADVYVLDQATGTARALIESPAYDADPDWSPDGGHVLFVSDREGSRAVYRFSLADGSVERLSGSGVTDISPEYSPDGRSIAFARTAPGETSRSAVMVAAADGAGARAVTPGTSQDALPTWSPDGTTIAFHRCDDGRCALWLVGADGTGERPILQDENDNRWPAWSPDGQWIAFTRRVGEGPTDIWLVRPDGSESRRVTRWPGADEGATWRTKPIESNP